METSKVCIIVCEDSLSELIAREALKKLGNGIVLCPLDEDVTEVEHVKDVMGKAEYVLVVDACFDECGKKRAEKLGIHYDEYLNLEKELGIKMPCSKKPSVEVVDDVGLAATYLVERIENILGKHQSHFYPILTSNAFK